MNSPLIQLLLALAMSLPVLSQSFHEDKLRELDVAVAKAIAEGRTPGAVVWIEAHGNVWHNAYGHRAVSPEREAMTLDTVFDVASLTKVIATAPAILKLAEWGELDLEQTVHSILPEFSGHGKEVITIRHLLTHTSGLPSGIPKATRPFDYEGGIAWIHGCVPKTATDTEMIYSDVNFILLGEIVQQVSGEPLDRFVRREIWHPLRMWDTDYHPDSALFPDIAPTETLAGESRPLRGLPHDPTCRLMGGATGNAGVFSTAADLARFARAALHGQEVTDETATTVTAQRGFGWDIDTWLSEMPRGEHFHVGKSFGHTGYTGTSMWIDPTRDMFVLILTNRLHPDGGDIRRLRHQIATLAAEAAEEISVTEVPSARVQNGIDVLFEDNYRPLQGKRIGLITNHTGIDRNESTTIDLLHDAETVELVRLFGPEHGIRGDIGPGENVDDGLDERTGLPVVSLYGSDSKKPDPRHLEDLDALVFDIQDIGSRFYTYISTMGLCMEAAAEHDLEFIVLDRLNPIGGEVVDGPVNIPERKFIAHHPIAIQHGMTVGELARMFATETNLDLELTIVPVSGWERTMRFVDTDLPWVNPSPNIRTQEAAVLYPGIGILEFTPLSVGRGTATPFEHVGAPWIDEDELAASLNALDLPGIQISPTRFTPDSSVHEGRSCGGVRFDITNMDAIRPLDTGIAIARILNQTEDDYSLARLPVLLLHGPTEDAIAQGKSNDEIRELWAEELEDFLARRSRFLLYE